MDGIEMVGTFKPTAWFQTLALILSQKYGANISVEVTPSAENERAAERTSA